MLTNLKLSVDLVFVFRQVKTEANVVKWKHSCVLPVSCLRNILKILRIFCNELAYWVTNAT